MKAATIQTYFIESRDGIDRVWRYEPVMHKGPGAPTLTTLRHIVSQWSERVSFREYRIRRRVTVVLEETVK